MADSSEPVAPAEVYFLELAGDLHDRMFEGALPQPGDVCEIVCVKAEKDRSRFQLRVRTSS